MTEKACNLWLEPAEYRCILTSGALSPDGSAILDDPTAIEAAKRFQGLEQDLGRLIAARGNHVHHIGNGVISFPVKQFQFAKPTLQFVQRSAKELADLVGASKTLLPRPGCRTGEMTWETVAPALAGLPDNIIVIQHT